MSGSGISEICSSKGYDFIGGVWRTQRNLVFVFLRYNNSIVTLGTTSSHTIVQLKRWENFCSIHCFSPSLAGFPLIKPETVSYVSYIWQRESCTAELRWNGMFTNYGKRFIWQAWPSVCDHLHGKTEIYSIWLLSPNASNAGTANGDDTLCISKHAAKMPRKASQFSLRHEEIEGSL